MKKLLTILLVLALVFSLAACGNGADEPEEPTNGEEPGEEEPGEEEEPLKVALLLNGTLGDLSFFDSAHDGLQRAKEQFGDDIVVETVEMTTDSSKWMPTLYDYSDDGTWDIIIVGTWELVEPLAEVAPQYPDQKYFLFDQSMDYSTGEFDNVYSITYKQNEVSFLTGALASIMTTSDQFEMVDPSEEAIGFLGGTDSPVINDFLVGYIEGAKYINDDIRVEISYVGNFSDTPKGKDLALAQYQNQGVDVGFNVAGLAGLGQIDAAVETDNYAIGVDSDQALIMGEPQANHIPTSALKNVGNSLVRGIEMHMNDEVPYGEADSLGLEDGGVGLAKNEYYEQIVPEDVRTQINDLEEMIANGEIEVDTAFGKTNEEIQAIKDSVE
ncbi:MAG: BMP family ABC transporter substrate-binding protein [Eubacteriales bacterium]